MQSAFPYGCPFSICECKRREEKRRNENDIVFKFAMFFYGGL